ncbi:Taf1p [Sugiyamaella lignohabitans]|uniref:Taf1p n=1 Tax=Sugiyamaella lignohabitans TaxID=796027 RepID=A0A167F645_9ASCO|nr:Taf1p [Sugiyamaella lignohabitans]ANB14883.1 Taf1p [Sugiyamaella lignohabitans]
MPPPTATEDAKEEEDWDKLFAPGATGGGIESIVPRDLSGADLIRPADNAIDFEDEDELADDEDEIQATQEAEKKVGNKLLDRDRVAPSGRPIRPEYDEEDDNDEEEIDMPDFFAHHRGGSLSINADGISLAGELDGGHGFNESWYDELTAEGQPGDMDIDIHPRASLSEIGEEEEEDFEKEGETEENAKPHVNQNALNVLNEGSDLLQDTGNMLKSDLIEEIDTIDDKTTNEQLLRAYYPEFRSGAVLKMHTIFGPKPSKLVLPKAKPVKQQSAAPIKTRLEIEADQKRVFRSNQLVEKVDTNVVKVNSSWIERSLRKTGRQDKDSLSDSHGLPEGVDKEIEFASADWYVFDDSESDVDDEPRSPLKDSETKDKATDESETVLKGDESTPEGPRELQVSGKRRRPKLDYSSLAMFDHEPYDSDDEDAFLEGVFQPLRKKTILDMNDSHLLFAHESQTRRMYNPTANSTVPTSESQLQSRYNISNDKAYDMLKENYQSKIRATIGNLNIDHSMIALRLQSPHYKVKLSKSQMRSFHRPSFVVKPNTTIHFSKVKQRKKKKDKGKHITQLLNKTGDLTLGDSAHFFLLEYCEEFPIVLSCFGMGSKLINYYRKRNNEDSERPKLAIGETHVLGVQDKSAFWNFGFVDPGKVVPTLYNRMIRAPIFKHDPKQTDFLLVRSTGGGVGQKYFLRTVQNVFVVGQTLPVTAIPGPHSRKVTTASKNRLKMVVYRVLNKNPHQRLQVKDISGHFPDQNDMQNRQRLKEFMEFQRSGDDQGFWKVKAGDTLPPEDAIRSMITPEDIVLLESMQVGQQHLEDAGYGKTVEDDQEDADGMSIEEQLAPWNISRNFINATQGKAMLQLHGEGDPSGRGEGFSFLRTSMKGGFKAMGESVNDKLEKSSKLGGHSYNVAIQQKIYNEEIKRIWQTQQKSLSVKDVSELGWDEAEHNRDNPPEPTGESSANTPGGGYDKEDDEMSLFSHNSTSNNQQNKVLKITRLVKDEYGVIQQKVEVVRDPNVIRAYVKRRQMVEDSLVV